MIYWADVTQDMSPTRWHPKKHICITDGTKVLHRTEVEQQDYKNKQICETHSIRLVHVQKTQIFL